MSSRTVPPSTSSTPLTNKKDSLEHLTEQERSRIKEFGQLFNRQTSINRALLEELFRKEPSEYTQTVYRYASRIYHCLKEDQVNPVLKALAATRDEPVQLKKTTLDVPRIDYASDKQKRRTLKLAFSVLRYQKILEELLEETQFFSNFPDLRDDVSLVSTILYDYLSRKFQTRDDPVDIDEKEDLSNNDVLVTTIENAILQERTRLAAALARNRIKSQALSLEDLLPENVREVQQHSAELPVYAWVNLIKTDMETVIKTFEEQEKLTRVKSFDAVDKRSFTIDYHCSNLLVFHYSQKTRIMMHPLVRDNLLYLQDKSSCTAAHTVRKLLTKKDNICLAYVSGGLLLQLLLTLTDELESKIYAFGARTDETIREIMGKIKLLGASDKRVKIFKESFTDVNFDEMNIESCKVILCNPPDSRSALIQPLEFLYNEGEDVSLLKQFSQPIENKTHVKECIQRELGYMRQAFRYSHGRGIVYVTFSKNKSENENVIQTMLDEQAEQRSQMVQKKDIGIYKVSPPTLKIQLISRGGETSILRQGTYIQFESSQQMNGVFIAVILREREKRRSSFAKKKNEEVNSDDEILRKTKKETTSFHLETETRAMLRRQTQNSPTKTTRRSSTNTINRRNKPNNNNTSSTRELASTQSTHVDQLLTQTNSNAASKRQPPKELTLSERLASIGRIASTVESTEAQQKPNDS